MYDEPDDEPDEFLSDAERISYLERKIAVLEERIARLDRDLKAVDVDGIREQMAAQREQTAVLKARIDALTDYRNTTIMHLKSLAFLVLMVLAVSAANLGVSLSAARP